MRSESGLLADAERIISKIYYKIICLLVLTVETSRINNVHWLLNEIKPPFPEKAGFSELGPRCHRCWMSSLIFPFRKNLYCSYILQKTSRGKVCRNECRNGFATLRPRFCDRKDPSARSFSVPSKSYHPLPGVISGRRRWHISEIRLTMTRNIPMRLAALAWKHLRTYFMRHIVGSLLSSRGYASSGFPLRLV